MLPSYYSSIFPQPHPQNSRLRTYGFLHIHNLFTTQMTRYDATLLYDPFYVLMAITEEFGHTTKRIELRKLSTYSETE